MNANPIPCINLDIKNKHEIRYKKWGCEPLNSAMKSNIRKKGVYSIKLPWALIDLDRVFSPKLLNAKNFKKEAPLSAITLVDNINNHIDNIDVNKVLIMYHFSHYFYQRYQK